MASSNSVTLPSKNRVLASIWFVFGILQLSFGIVIYLQYVLQPGVLWYVMIPNEMLFRDMFFGGLALFIGRLLWIKSQEVSFYILALFISIILFLVSIEIKFWFIYKEFEVMLLLSHDYLYYVLGLVSLLWLKKQKISIVRVDIKLILVSSIITSLIMILSYLLDYNNLKYLL